MSVNTNESFGQTVEYALALAAKVPCTIDPGRTNRTTVINSEFRKTIDEILTKIPKITTHLGTDNKSEDFALKDGTFLSVKSNISTPKVCPNTIGQISRDKWLQFFKDEETKNENEDTIQKIKDRFYNNPSLIINKYLKFLFSHEYLLWLYNTENAFQYKILKVQSFTFDKDRIEFTRSREMFNESVTVKYIIKDDPKYTHFTCQKPISFGEFQIHSNRNGVKFRFHMVGLLKILTIEELDIKIEKFKEPEISREVKQNEPENIKSKREIYQTYNLTKVKDVARELKIKCFSKYKLDQKDKLIDLILEQQFKSNIETSDTLKELNMKLLKEKAKNLGIKNSKNYTLATKDELINLITQSIEKNKNN